MEQLKAFRSGSQKTASQTQNLIKNFRGKMLPSIFTSKDKLAQGNYLQVPGKNSKTSQLNQKVQTIHVTTENVKSFQIDSTVSNMFASNPIFQGMSNMRFDNGPLTWAHLSQEVLSHFAQSIPIRHYKQIIEGEEIEQERQSAYWRKVPVSPSVTRKIIFRNQTNKLERTTSAPHLNVRREQESALMDQIQDFQAEVMTMIKLGPGYYTRRRSCQCRHCKYSKKYNGLFMVFEDDLSYRARERRKVLLRKVSRVLKDKTKSIFSMKMMAAQMNQSSGQYPRKSKQVNLRVMKRINSVGSDGFFGLRKQQSQTELKLTQTNSQRLSIKPQVSIASKRAQAQINFENQLGSLDPDTPMLRSEDSMEASKAKIKEVDNEDDIGLDAILKDLNFKHGKNQAVSMANVQIPQLTLDQDNLRQITEEATPKLEKSTGKRANQVDQKQKLLDKYKIVPKYQGVENCLTERQKLEIRQKATVAPRSARYNKKDELKAIHFDSLKQYTRTKQENLEVQQELASYFSSKLGKTLSFKTGLTKKSQTQRGTFKTRRTTSDIIAPPKICKYGISS